MNTTICNRCLRAVRRKFNPVANTKTASLKQNRRARSHSWSSKAPAQDTDIASLLSRPTWSVRSLLSQPQAAAAEPPPHSQSQSPPSTSSSSTPAPTPAPAPAITRSTLSHLLRLSALPQPGSEAEAESLVRDLEAQLAFVRAVRDVDTKGVEPLRAVRDETAAGARERAVGLDALRPVLAREDVVGHARRPRRRRQGADTGEGEGARIKGVEDWDVLAGASETAGPYFVVRSAGAGSARQNETDRSQ